MVVLNLTSHTQTYTREHTHIQRLSTQTQLPFWSWCPVGKAQLSVHGLLLSSATRQIWRSTWLYVSRLLTLSESCSQSQGCIQINLSQSCLPYISLQSGRHSVSHHSQYSQSKRCIYSVTDVCVYLYMVKPWLLQTTTEYTVPFRPAVVLLF